MTEDDAKTKACPVAFRPSTYDGRPVRTECIASACMAWRQESETLTKLRGEKWSRPKDGHGFCGLAGAPT